MVSTSWAVTVAPLIIFLIGLAFSAVGVDIPTDVQDAIDMLVYFFIASAFTGGAVSIAKTKYKAQIKSVA